MLIIGMFLVNVIVIFLIVLFIGLKMVKFIKLIIIGIKFMLKGELVFL